MRDAATSRAALGALVFLALQCIGDAAGQATVAGTATYRERMLLPPRAVFEATLIDVSRADAPAEVIALDQVLSPRSSPIRFKLRYDPARIHPEKSYVVRGRISVNGQSMFTTDTAYAVLTQGNPDSVDLVLKRVRGRPDAQPAPGVGRRLSGMLRYMADAGRFQDCASGRTYPVAVEADNAALERGYSVARSEPGAPVLVTVIARIEQRPTMEGEGTQESLVVEKFEKAWPGQQCPSELALRLESIRWKASRCWCDERRADRVPKPALAALDGHGLARAWFRRLYRLCGERSTRARHLDARTACSDVHIVRGDDSARAGLFKALSIVAGYRVDADELSLPAADGALLAFVAARKR